MPHVSNCPECGRPVTIPDGLGADARVRCPLCEAEYTPGDTPPEVVVLDPGSAPSAPADEAESSFAAGLMPFADETPADTATAEEVSVEEESSDEDYGVAGEGGAEPGEEVGVAAAESEGEEGGEEEGGEGEHEGGPVLDIWQKEHAVPSIDFGQGTDTVQHEGVDASAFAGFAADEEEADIDGKPRSVAARPGRRGRKQKNVFKEMVGAILGGFAGLVIGYYLLNYFGGERFDFMNVWLPLVPHTQKYWEGDSTEASTDSASESGSGTAPSDPAAPKSPKLPKQPQQFVLPEEPSSPASPPPNEFGFDPMNQGVGDPLAVTEAPKIELDVTPEPEPTVGLRKPPSVPAKQLGDALKQANAAVRGEDATGEITEDVFEKLSQLAHRVTFVKPGGAQVADRKQAIQKMLEEIAADPVAVHQISQRTVTPLEDVDGPDRGVIVAGVIGEIRERNGLFATPLKPVGMDHTVVVASTRPLSLPERQPVLILGSIVHQPTKKVIDWKAERPMIIWHGMGVAIPKEETEPDLSAEPEPAAEPEKEPAAEPAEEPATEPAEEPAAEPAEEPAAEPAEKPAAEPDPEPAPVPEEPTLPEPELTPSLGPGADGAEATP